MSFRVDNIFSLSLLIRDNAKKDNENIRKSIGGNKIRNFIAISIRAIVLSFNGLVNQSISLILQLGTGLVNVVNTRARICVYYFYPAVRDNQQNQLFKLGSCNFSTGHNQNRPPATFNGYNGYFY